MTAFFPRLPFHIREILARQLFISPRDLHLAINSSTLTAFLAHTSEVERCKNAFSAVIVMGCDRVEDQRG